MFSISYIELNWIILLTHQFQCNAINYNFEHLGLRILLACHDKRSKNLEVYFFYDHCALSKLHTESPVDRCKQSNVSSTKNIFRGSKTSKIIQILLIRNTQIRCRPSELQRKLQQLAGHNHIQTYPTSHWHHSQPKQIYIMDFWHISVFLDYNC